MDTSIIEIVGKIAGIGGLSLGIFLILYRNILAKNIFPTLTKEQATSIILVITVLTWSIALAGLGAWVYVTTQNNKEIKSSSSINVIPIDIFSKLYPGVTATEAIKFLGESPRKVPSKELADTKKELWLYPLEDGVIQLDIEDNRIIAIAVEQNSNSRLIPISPLNRTLPNINPFLGKMTFDSLKDESCSAPRFSSAARTAISYSECYFGLPGTYFSYVFGTTNSGEQLANGNNKFNYVVAMGTSNLDTERSKWENGHCDAFSICQEYLPPAL